MNLARGDFWCTGIIPHDEEIDNYKTGGILHLVDMEHLFYSMACGIMKILSEKGGRAMAKTNGKQTSKSVATKASKIMRDDRYSATSKSVAASALSQTKPTKK